MKRETLRYPGYDVLQSIVKDPWRRCHHGERQRWEGTKSNFQDGETVLNWCESSSWVCTSFRTGLAWLVHGVRFCDEYEGNTKNPGSLWPEPAGRMALGKAMSQYVKYRCPPHESAMAPPAPKHAPFCHRPGNKKKTLLPLANDRSERPINPRSHQSVNHN